MAATHAATLLLQGKTVRTQAANGTNPVVRKIFKRCSRLDPILGITFLGVVDVMIEGGEDVKFIARRLIILAAEDVGLANPNALLLANNCFQAVNIIGFPEIPEFTGFIAGTSRVPVPGSL